MDKYVFIAGLFISLIGIGGIAGFIPFPGSPITLSTTGCPDLNCATTIGAIGFGTYYVPVNSLTPLQVGIPSAPLVIGFTMSPGITIASRSILYCYAQTPCTPTTALTSTIAYATGFSGGSITTSTLTLSQNTFLLITLVDSAGATVTATGALTYNGGTTPGIAVITVLSNSGVPTSGAQVTVTPSAGGSPVTGTTAGPAGTVSFSLAGGSYSASASAIAVGTGSTTFTISPGVTTNAAITLGGLTTSSTSVSCGTVTSNGAGGTTSCTATVTGSSPSGTVTWSQSGGNGVNSFFPTSCTLVSGACTTQYSQSGAGTTMIKGSYSGNIYNSASSGSASATFLSLASTVTNVGCTPSMQLTQGQPTTCTATVTAIGSTPAGVVTWTSNLAGTFTPATTCTLSSGGSCSVTYAQNILGTATITASYGGSSNNAPSSGTYTVSYGSSVICMVYVTTTVGDGSTTTSATSCFGSTTSTTTSTVSSTTTQPFSCTTDLLHAAVSVLVQDGTSKPIAGATVSITGVGGATTTTNANGLACLSGLVTLVGASVTVNVAASGFGSTSASIPVSIGQVSTYTFTLQGGVGTFSVNPFALLVLLSGLVISAYGAKRKRDGGD